MTIRIESDIARCKALWNRFSPRQSLYDLWEFRFPFWEVFRFELSFLVLKRDGADAGMLPLWYHPEQRRHLWFGDTGDGFNWQEGTSIWARSSEDARALIDACPRPALLTSISQGCRNCFGSLFPFREADPKSFLALAGIPSVDAYLQTLPKKLRQNLRRDRSAIAARNPVILRSGVSLFPSLIALNSRKFSDSPFLDPRMVEVFERLIGAQHDPPYGTHLFAAEIAGSIAAVDLLFFFNGIAYSLLCGSDTLRFPGVGNFMTLLDIEAALERGCSAIDFTEYEGGSANYKGRLFPSLSQYALKLDT